MTAPLSRRRALSGAATLGVSVPLLAACGDDGGTTAAEPTSSGPASTGPASPSGGASSSAPAGSPGAAPANALVATADVPVGGGVILKDEEVVVTQPEAGEFKAFSAICTHQACLVTSVEDGAIACACHGSMFSVDDGSVTGGPAPSALPEVAVDVRGDQVVKA
ncbi:nitrite reductase/ring-hydroxylating ferredoxin subunit [Nocardioides sp. J9]|uniref:Rieske (2Fe-2S) protein n=1 Tax=Nocardioides sp. J9 TaxID=935844 RepID=UPI0011A3CCB6|nr:Rieske (2Fe-2S) protein [Nocardioides sp. J9]TWG93117.1 nitrite reductase/ring-hydroxylating ferredoxin subunit [Nocardioides sp. J9]